MKKLLLYSGVAMLFFAGVISCVKDAGLLVNSSVLSDSTGTTCRVSSARFMNYPYFDRETKMQYDSSGRLIKVIDYDSAGARRSVSFGYATGKIIEIDSVASAGSGGINLQTVIIHHEIGANGYASVSYFHNQDGVRDTAFYTYDADGYLTKWVHKHYSANASDTQHLVYVDTYDYTISGGNRVREVLNGKTIVRYFYDGQTSKSGGFNFIKYSDYPFLGKKNVSLVKVLYHFNTESGDSARSDYNYKFDSTGKPIVVYHSHVTGLDSLALGYICK